MPEQDLILVTYATYLGSTAGVAEAIGKALTESGKNVIVRLMKEVTDLTPYRAVIAGSAIHSGKWLPDAMDWVTQHQAQLAQKPFAAFLVCLTLAMKSKKAIENANVPKFLDEVRALVPPIDEGYFAGTLDLKKIPYPMARFGFRISVWTGVWKEGDHRDWNAITAWGKGLAGKL